MKITEGITEATDPTETIKVVIENSTEVPNIGEGVSKTIIGDNTKATVGNTTPPVGAITIIIITAIIKIEVDMAVVVITTGVTAMAEAVVKAITITNIIIITHMMMPHRWSNMASHAHFSLWKK